MDTIGFTLHREIVPNTDLKAEISPYLTAITGEGLTHGIHTIYGKLKNLDVSITDEKVNIKNGSLCKYYLGDNINELGRSGIQKAIEDLSDTLHLPIQKAIVNKFHFGINIMLSFEPEVYFPYLGDYGRFKRLSQPHGINYKVSGREYVFYDKIRELKSHREAIPPLFSNRHILRIESRYNRNVNCYFNQTKIEANLLYEDGFYIEINKDLARAYKQINKIKTIKIDMTNVTTKKELQKLGVLSLIKLEGGVTQALENIKERYKRGELTKKQHHDLKVLYEQCSKMSLQTRDSELIAELDRKIDEKMKFFI